MNSETRTSAAASAASHFALAWIGVGTASRQAAEYRLASRLLNEEIGPGVPIVAVDVHDSAVDAGTYGDPREAALDKAVRAWLADDPPAQAMILLVRDSWTVSAPGSIDALQRVLGQMREVDCVVPLQPELLPPDCTPNYQTPSGIETFHRLLKERVRSNAQPPAGHRPALFAVRAGVLHDLLPTTDLFGVPARLGARCAVAPSAYAHPLPAYHGLDRADMLPLVPAGTSALLDIGCGAGAFAASVKQALGCRAVGIEMLPAIAAQAARRLDEVLIGDALVLDLPELFDCVTMLDSLEHMTEPDLFLSRVANQWLAPGGCVIASAPNVGHWSLVLDQLAGRWDYVPAGLLCETHVRFFTEHSLRVLFRRHGLGVTALHRVELPAPPTLRAQLSGFAQAGFPVDERSLDTLAFHLVARHVG